MAPEQVLRIQPATLLHQDNKAPKATTQPDPAATAAKTATQTAGLPASQPAGSAYPSGAGNPPGQASPQDSADTERPAYLPVIMMENMSSLPALERSAVMLSHGSVLSPSSRWYWEGTPAEITASAVAAGLEGATDYTLLMPWRGRLAHDATLTGRVEAFEYRQQEAVLRIRVRFSLWAPRGTHLLSGHVAQAQYPVAHAQAQDIAEAASHGMAEVTASVHNWLATEGMASLRAFRLAQDMEKPRPAGQTRPEGQVQPAGQVQPSGQAQPTGQAQPAGQKQ